MKNSINFSISTKFSNIVLHECHQNYSHQMPDLLFKMHPIQFSSQHSPDPLTGFGREEKREMGKKTGEVGREKDDSWSLGGSTPMFRCHIGI